MKLEYKGHWDSLPPFKPPDKCECPPPGAFTLLAFELEEAKAEAAKGHACRYMAMDDMRSLIFGSSQDVEGQVFDGHKSVKDQHACLYYMKGKWFLKSVNGPTVIESITLHPYIRDADGKPPKRYISDDKKHDTFSPMDPKRKLTREMCTFRLGESNRRFWLLGPLPLGDGESEELAPDAQRGGDRKKERREKDRKEDDRHGRSRSRSRSRKRRK